MKRMNISTLCVPLALLSLAACTTTNDSSTIDAGGEASNTTTVNSGTATGPSTSATDGAAALDDDSYPLRPIDESMIAPFGESAAGAAADPFQPVELDPVESPMPAPPPPPAPPGPVDLTANPVVIDDLSSNAFGCASTCIVSAQLQVGTFGTDISIEAETNVTTRMRLWVSTQPIVEAADGSLFFEGGSRTVASSRLGRTWNDGIDNLEGNTTYHAIFRAIDTQGNKAYLTATFETGFEQADDLVAGSGCEFQCITTGVVQDGGQWDTVNLDVTVDVPARLSVYVSTAEPGWIGDAPVLPESALVQQPTNLGTSWTIPVSGLQGDTRYHVIVRAEDASGATAHRVGTFRTVPQPPTRIRATVERIYVAHDGDPGPNRGELIFVWGPIGEGLNFGWADMGRMSDGENFVPAGTRSWDLAVEPGARLPLFGATAWEEDYDGHFEQSCWIQHSIGPRTSPVYLDLCDMRITPGYAQPLTVDDLDSLLRCSQYGFIEGEDNACLLIASPYVSDDYAEIKVLVSFEVL